MGRKTWKSEVFGRRWWGDRCGEAACTHRETEPAVARASTDESRKPGGAQSVEEAARGLFAPAGEVRTAERDPGGAFELCQDRPGRQLSAHEGRPRGGEALAETGLQCADRHRGAVHHRFQHSQPGRRHALPDPASRTGAQNHGGTLTEKDRGGCRLRQ